MRVLHVIESLEHGGAEAVVVELANASGADAAGVCCVKRIGELGERLSPGVAVHCLGKGEGNDFRVPFRLARLARRGGFDVLHSHSWGVYLETVMAACLSGRRAVHTVHGPYRASGPGWKSRSKAGLRRVLERFASRRVAAIACVSTAVHAAVSDLLGAAAPLHVVHNGIAPRPRVRRRPPTASPRFISVGRLAAVKAQHVLLDAFAQVAATVPGARLTLVGDGPERDRLGVRAAELGISEQVTFAGFREDVDELLAAHHVFVLSSVHEGISIALLEAMRIGLPVVATRVGGIPETVAEGISGLLVEPDDPRALADAMLTVVGDPARFQSMSEAARRVQQQRFALARMHAEYLRLYRGTSIREAADAPRSGSTAPLRILYHHRTQGRGAEGTHIASIVEALRGMGHDVTVLGPPGVDVMANAGAAPVDKAAVATRGTQTLWKLLSRHAPAWGFEVGEILYNLMAARRLRRLCKRQRFDLIYERYAFYLVAGAHCAQRRRIPFVLEANEVNGLAERARQQAMPRLCARFERRLLSRCDGILVVSSYLRDLLLERGVPAARIRVVPNAIAAAPDPVMPGAVRELRSRYGLQGRVVIGFAGWFDRWDRLDMLIEALAELADEFPAASVLLVGDGPVATELAATTRRLGLERRVVLAGPVPRAEMSAHLELFDVAALPHSNRFGSPVVLFEFMAHGLPVVAPRLAPIEDVLLDGESGRLFDPLDRAGLTQALRQVLGSAAERDRLGSTARAQVLRAHTWRRNAAHILEVAGFETHDAESREVSRAS